MSAGRRLLTCDGVRRGEKNINVSLQLRLGFFHRAFLVSPQDALAQLTFLLQLIGSCMGRGLSGSERSSMVRAFL